jgi:hypothetical protein
MSLTDPTAKFASTSSKVPLPCWSSPVARELFGSFQAAQPTGLQMGYETAALHVSEQVVVTVAGEEALPSWR